jgi:hypothetical protein
MDWCRLSANYYRDPAVVRAGELAEVLFLRMLAYCAENETRGRVPKAALPLLTPTKTKPRTAALMKEGLLLDHGDELLVRSWERIQEAHDSEAERRRKDRERKAAARLAAKQADDDTTVGGMSADIPPDEPQNVQAKSARIEVEVEEEQKTSSSGTRKRATPPPETFPITAEMAEWGREHCPSVADPVAETQQFLDYHRGKGSSQKDWLATWRTWMRNAEKYAARDNVHPLRATDRELAPDKEWIRYS